MGKLCLMKNFWIIKHFNNINLLYKLYKKSGLINKCHHSNKMLLKQVKRNESSVILIALSLFFVFYMNFLTF